MKDQLSHERIYMRTNLATKSFLEAAAILSGYNNLTSFVLTTAYKEAQRVINESQGRILSERDRDLILNLLSNPPEPNKKLRNLLLDAAKRNEQEDENKDAIE